MRSTIAMTPGTVYTVISSDSHEPAERPRQIRPLPLRAGARPPRPGSPAPARPLRASRGPRPARSSPSARATTTYAEVTALEAWMGRHVRYSTDIPPLLPGQDAVNHFLFGSRVGYCEQISTALAVMLRTLGVPTREAIGYVPGPVRPLERPLRDPGQGRPRLGAGVVPGSRLAELRPDRSGATRTARPRRRAALRRRPRASPTFPGHRSARVLGAIGCALLAVAGSQPAPSSPAAGWLAQVTAELERRGAAVGLEAPVAETLGEYAARLGAYRAVAEQARSATASLGRGGGAARACRLRRLRAGRPDTRASSRTSCAGSVPLAVFDERGRGHRLTTA